MVCGVDTTRGGVNIMGSYRILGRFDEGNVGEKCPRCLMVGVNFLDMGGKVLVVRTTFTDTVRNNFNRS